ncbi:MAG: hypothetical protein GF365_04315 [Candidatus Buchananbacteria bacterium]|nr:hypothetical protein [Candidatus Buchananbacteria bacterium]
MKFKKIKLTIFFSVIFLSVKPLVGLATTAETAKLKLQVPLLDYTEASNIAEYIGNIYTAVLYIIVPIIIVVIIFSGILWVIAGGNQELINKAKSRILHGFIGLGIALFSYVLLSFVGIKEITTPGIAKIDPVKGQYIIIDGEVLSVDEAMSKLPPERRGKMSAFDAASCPKGQTTFEVFFTNYYFPQYGESYGNNDFFCNVGMQCSCPKGKDTSRQCNYGKRYNPCAYFPKGTPYCNATASGRPPKANYTVAADDSCFKYGCKFTIQGSASNTYEIMDTGSWIKNRHMDLFVGTRSNINKIHGVYTINLLNPSACFK